MTDFRLNEVELNVRNSYLTSLGRIAVLGLVILVCSAYTGLLISSGSLKADLPLQAWLSK